MAGGAKESPRQKMINLMYMVFIAMLAMQMDKKVLSSFGFMKEKTEDANAFSAKTIDGVLKQISAKASEQPEKFGPINDDAKAIHKASEKIFNFLDGIVTKVYEGEDKEFEKQYEAQKGADKVDSMFFAGDKHTETGEEFVKGIESYKKQIIKVLGKKRIGKSPFKVLVEKIEKRFNVSPDKSDEGKEIDWLRSRYEGMPMITSVANIRQIQADIRSTEKELYDAFVGNQNKADASMNNFNGVVSLDKTAFYPGDKVTGSIVLGRYDASLKPSKVIYNGANYTKFKDGAVVIDEVASSVGTKPIEGVIVFKEEGKDVKIPFKSSYSVIPRPNGAVISADKMNVVYRGLPNPVTISIPGISGDKVSAKAPGLRRVKGNKYVLTPRGGSSVKINVSGTLDNGKSINDAKVFRIKNVPNPVTMVRGGQYGAISMPKSSIQGLTIQAGLPDFLFDIKYVVKSFKVKVSGQPTVVVSGNRMSAKAKKAISKVRRRQMVTIFDTQVSAIGYPGVKSKKVANLAITVNN